METTQREAPAESGHLIKRPRLTRMLDESKARIILLVAPAGYGKTTLAREWLEGKPHVWYRASSADADVAALAVGLASAAAELVPGVDRRIRQRVKAARDPEREASALAELVAEDLAQLADETWIAIDDYQFIGESGAAETFVGELLDAAGMPSVLTSRTRPDWARARGVVYGGVADLGRDELQMTDPEVSEALQRSRDEVPTLFENAMGWPAIVGLAARVGPGLLENQVLPSSLHDFFAEELWHFQDETTRWRLTQIALVSPLSRNAVEGLLGDDAAELIERTTKAGWLTPDQNDVVIHPLLARFLQQRFQQYSAGSRREAVQRLIAVLAEEGHWDQAMTLAVESDRSAIASVFEQSLEALLSDGRLTTIERWLDTARHHAADSPVLNLAAAEVALRRGDCARAETFARLAAEEAPSAAFRVRSLNTAGRSARWNDRSDVAVELHREARSLAEDRPSLREALIGEILASLDVGRIAARDLLAQLPSDDGSALDRVRRATVEAQVDVHLGSAQDAIAVTTSTLSLLDDVDDPLARTSFLNVRALALTAGAHYRAALEVLAAFEREATDFRVEFAVSGARLSRAAAEAGLRNFTRARQIVRELVAAGEIENDPFIIANASALEARIEVAAGSGLIPPLRAGLRTQSNAGVYPEYIRSIALAEAAFGDPERARALQRSCAGGYLTTEAQLLGLWVEAIIRPSDINVVSTAFELTLTRACADPFVVAYRGAPVIIETLLTIPLYRDQVTEIMIRANDLELAERLDLATAARAAKRQRLTRREREVYALMIDGLSNRSIAARLFISEPTAKLHVRHILEKLSARSRAEAVAKWRDILPDG